MPRLVTFGCSFTFGHGLPDCFDPPDGHGPIASVLGWPNMLANKLNRECINLSKPGSGNKEILIKILNTKFLPDDMVVVGWSHFNRYDFYRHTDENEGYRITGDEIEEVVFKVNVNDQNWLNNNRVENFLCIHHANIFLSNLHLQQYNFFAVHSENSNQMPSFRLKNFYDIRPPTWIVDKALDKNPDEPFHFNAKGHPGLESQKVLTDILYEKICRG